MTFYARVTSYSDRGSDWSRQDPGVVTTPFTRADHPARDYENTWSLAEHDLKSRRSAATTRHGLEQRQYFLLSHQTWDYMHPLSGWR